MLNFGLHVLSGDLHLWLRPCALEAAVAISCIVHDFSYGWMVHTLEHKLQIILDLKGFPLLGYPSTSCIVHRCASQHFYLILGNLLALQLAACPPPCSILIQGIKASGNCTGRAHPWLRLRFCTPGSPPLLLEALLPEQSLIVHALSKVLH